MLSPVSALDLRALLSRPCSADDAIAPLPVLTMLADLAERIETLFAPAAWQVVDAGQPVGLFSLTRPPEQGVLDIGYGIAPAHQGRGLAGRALAELVTWARHDARVCCLTAETAVRNARSQAVLRRNGFMVTGRRIDAEDGPVVCWQLPVNSD
ncbi:GNAT family N-acetyltransferase [Stenotrophomonas sp. GD03908]|uniref:GNAT family protein n=1 Tax=Stenotrophomonas maltophilia TaxID=40324 RepID=A0AAJ2TJN0_STEMA|nr:MULTISPECIES: GNAT family protein [Stenotrophomonas]MBH1483406.1 GNAT family N-acetyltransferase [Stenotrophomonas maltophilia]MCU1064961.1 GNAT family N-acetyltransferase [Stenotrophomonas maltophilia]MDH0981152.1 GNAT family N-acetyltransferase [Stenotrophomonas sp. GD03908]MDQ7294052.1 GNAT family protein [Stenotrophomonas sp. Sm0041]MDZ5763535.1 GNAT family protein [Stenotrophomonas maltophilia]